MGRKKGSGAGLQLVPRTKCLVCGGLFYAPPVQRRRGGGIYCSKECYGISMKKYFHERKCKGCGDSFTVMSEGDPNKYPSRCSSCAMKLSLARAMNSVKNITKIVTSQLIKARIGAYIIPHNMSKDQPIEINDGKYNCIGFCKTCGVRFVGHFNRELCSPKCTKSKVKANAKCLKCGGDFYSAPSHRAKGWGLYCSMRCRPVNVSYTAGKGGTRSDLGIYVRSSWEANYARYLNFLMANGLILKWEYEPTTFYFHAIKRGVRSYKPDFLITEVGGRQVYHEVKGYMDDKSKTKLARMAKFYPEHKVIVVASKEMRDIKNKVAALIPNWEYGENDKLGYNRVAVKRSRWSKR